MGLDARLAGQQGGDAAARTAARALNTRPPLPTHLPAHGVHHPQALRFGLDVHATYLADWSSPLAGGRRSRDTYRGLLTVLASWDPEPTTGWRGAEFHFDIQHQVGRDGSLDTGDLQVYSNLDAPNHTQVAELWVAQSLGHGFRIKAGKVDANAEFSAVEAAGSFIHSSAGFSPTVVTFPSYPYPAASVCGFWSGSRYDFGIGLFDEQNSRRVATGSNQPDPWFPDAFAGELFAVAEAGAKLGPEAAPVGRVALGLWHSTDRFDRFDGGTERGATGVYATYEQRVSWESADPTAGDPAARIPERGEGLTVFGIVGAADPDVAAIHQHALAGLRYTGLLPRRPADECGLLVSWARTSDRAGAALPHDETAVELFYGWRFCENFTLQPDIQFIHNPGGVSGADDALVFTLRIAASF